MTVISKFIPVDPNNLFMPLESNNLVCIVGYRDEGKIVTYDGTNWTINDIKRL